MMRVGIGYDVHPLERGLPCFIGGVQIPYEKGLKGYSDGDVLLHAISDALLGAIGAGDIGRHFQPGDPRWKGISSLRLLEIVSKMIVDQGYRVVNCDSVVMAEAPKILPYVDEMKQKIARTLLMTPDEINVKGTTLEKLGFIGRGEGIAAQAVCLLEKVRHVSDG